MPAPAASARARWPRRAGAWSSSGPADLFRGGHAVIEKRAVGRTGHRSAVPPFGAAALAQASQGGGGGGADPGARPLLRGDRARLDDGRYAWTQPGALRLRFRALALQLLLRPERALPAELRRGADDLPGAERGCADHQDDRARPVGDHGPDAHDVVSAAGGPGGHRPGHSLDPRPAGDLRQHRRRPRAPPEDPGRGQPLRASDAGGGDGGHARLDQDDVAVRAPRVTRGERPPMRVLIAIVVVALVGMLGATEEASAQGPVRIGFISPLSGAIAQAGKDMYSGCELYWEETGWQLAGRKLEVILEDNEGVPATAVTKARKLVESDRVHMLAGVILSNVAYALVPYIEAQGIPTIYPINSADDLTQRKRPKWLIRTG